jgi:hypothetical protein
VAQASLRVDGVEMPLSPGMVVSAEVATGRRRLLEYFPESHDPVGLRERARALRAYPVSRLMKIVRDYFSLRVLLAAGVLAALLSTCGYVPWPSEVKAKRVAVEKLRSTLEALPKPADFRSAKFPGTDSDDVRYHGIYRAKNAFLTAIYLTSLPLDEACQLYRQFIETQQHWDVVGSPCRSGSGANPYRGVGAIGKFPWRSRERFQIHLVIRRPEVPPGVEPIGSEIVLEMSYALDQRAETDCTPPELSVRPWPYVRTASGDPYVSDVFTWLAEPDRLAAIGNVASIRSSRTSGPRTFRAATRFAWSRSAQRCSATWDPVSTRTPTRDTSSSSTL